MAGAITDDFDFAPNPIALALSAASEATDDAPVSAGAGDLGGDGVETSGAAAAAGGAAVAVVTLGRSAGGEGEAPPAPGGGEGALDCVGAAATMRTGPLLRTFDFPPAAPPLDTAPCIGTAAGDNAIEALTSGPAGELPFEGGPSGWSGTPRGFAAADNEGREDAMNLPLSMEVALLLEGITGAMAPGRLPGTGPCATLFGSMVGPPMAALFEAAGADSSDTAGDSTVPPLALACMSLWPPLTSSPSVRASFGGRCCSAGALLGGATMVGPELAASLAAEASFTFCSSSWFAACS